MKSSIPDFPVLERRYSRLLADVDEIISPLIGMLRIEDLATHNAGYLAYAGDPFQSLVANERRRFLFAIDLIVQGGVRRSVCDLGCFIPYIPVALARLGMRVTIVDKYDLYGAGFYRAISEAADRSGITLCNRDIISDDLSNLGHFDAVLLMAVVEHLIGSPKELLGKVRTALLVPDGQLIFEVPNIADLMKRFQLLFGRSPLAPYDAYLASEYPFFGHNREMTMAEVRFLLDRTGFQIEMMTCYDYSVPRRPLGHVLQMIKRILPGTGGSILATARSSRAA